MIFLIIGFSMIIIPMIVFTIWALFIDPIKTFIEAKRRLKELHNSDDLTRYEIKSNYNFAVGDLKVTFIVLFVIAHDKKDADNLKVEKASYIDRYVRQTYGAQFDRFEVSLTSSA